MFSRAPVLATPLTCIVLCLSLLPLGNAASATTKCGIRNVGGVDAETRSESSNNGVSDFGEFPWTVSIATAADKGYFCTGSLIHPKVVLTAGQCMQFKGSENLTIRAGLWNVDNDNERFPYQERQKEKFIIHPDKNRFSNDFALIILDEPFTLAAHINVICLPSANHITANGTSCYASGWGHRDDGPSKTMKRVTLSTVDLQTCQTQLDIPLKRRKLDNTVICAIGQNGTDTCNGDSGAPMFCRIGSGTEEQYQQIGITSFGSACLAGFPGGYADVASARSWIDKVMAENGL